jgi:hypothetical protein
MFKDSRAARRAMLIAGVGQTMPMRVADINRGWKADLVVVDEAEYINFVLSEKYMSKLTLGAQYGKSGEEA